MEKDEIREALEPVVKTLEEFGISYYIGGSIASSVYGIARATMDIDLISDLKQSHIKLLIQKLSGDYFIDENMILDAIKTRSSFNLIHLKTMMKIDVFILKEKEYHQKVLERRKKDFISDEPDSIEVYLASVEDIILTKLEWYKEGGNISERQWKDILGVIKVQRNLLDREYLKKWAKEIGVFDLLNKALIEGNLKDF